MRKNIIRRLILGVFLLVTVWAGAEEIALVTRVQGAVQACFDNASWAVQLGETLPTDTTVTIPSGGALDLAHLRLNCEMLLPEGTVAIIRADRVDATPPCQTGPKLAQGPATLDLEARSQLQVGATDPQFHASPAKPSAETKKKGEAQAAIEEGGMRAGPLGIGGNKNVQSEILPPSRAPDAGGPPNKLVAAPHPPTPAPALEVRTDDAAQDLGEPTVPPHQSFSNHFDKEHPTVLNQGGALPGVTPPRFGDRFALPVSLAGDFLTASSTSIQILCGPDELPLDTVRSPEGFASWTVILLASPIESEDDRVDLKLIPQAQEPTPYVLSFLIRSAEHDANLPFLAALIERQGHSAQAAALWLWLAEQGSVRPEIAAAHLQRLEKKFPTRPTH